MTRYPHLPPTSAPLGLDSRLRLRFAWMARTIMLCLALCLFTSTAMAQTSAVRANPYSSEESLKAVYLYKFLNYVEWPPAAFAKADSPYVFGVVNAEAVADELEKLAAGHTVNSRAVTVRRMQSGDSLSAIHVLFIGASERVKQLQLFKQAQKQPVLLVTETEGALALGSMINFRLAEERVRFEVALEPVEKSGLTLNTRILGVALNVIKGPQ